MNINKPNENPPIPHIRPADCRVRKSKQATYNVEKRLVKKEYVKQN